MVIKCDCGNEIILQKDKEISLDEEFDIKTTHEKCGDPVSVVCKKCNKPTLVVISREDGK